MTKNLKDLSIKQNNAILLYKIMTIKLDQFLMKINNSKNISDKLKSTSTKLSKLKSKTEP